MKLAMKGAVGLLAVAVVGFAGCARVEPWDRDVLARPDMEASSGGQGFGGGGCGCN
jgi:hypothetical protein